MQLIEFRFEILKRKSVVVNNKKIAKDRLGNRTNLSFS